MNLDRARQIGDPEADEALAAALEQAELAAINALLGRMIANDDPVPRELPAPLYDFLERTSVMPAWFDPTVLQRAHALASDRLLSLVTALFCAALPTMYAASKGALILVATRRMHGDLDRRVKETGRFVLDVLQPGAFGGRGRAIRSAQKVRLLHAMIRRFVRAPAEVPISQEDLLGTLFGFSLVTLRASDQLEGASSAREREAYHQLWRLVGHFIGVAPELVPSSWDDATLLAEEITERQIGPSDHGRALADELVRAMERHLLPGIPRRLMAQLLDDRVKRAIGLDAGSSRVTIPRALLRAFRPFARALMERWLERELDGRQPTFRLACGLGERWDLTST